MKFVLSRKGFDSGAGKCPSPIIDGRPVSMPIPASKNSSTTYAAVGLGEVVERITRGRIGRDSLCHHDPMFADGRCYFGQCDSAQTHLSNNGIGLGDVFLFFGLFADEGTGERHHRIFGYMRVEAIHLIAGAPPEIERRLGRLGHPHVIGVRHANNTVYEGEGATASQSHPALRLTKPGGPLSRWTVPTWLEAKGLTYHGKPSRWSGTELQSVARGQEFVSDVGSDPVARGWIDDIIGLIRS